MADYTRPEAKEGADVEATQVLLAGFTAEKPRLEVHGRKGEGGNPWRKTE
jgi:hypothetical protein